MSHMWKPNSFDDYLESKMSDQSKPREWWVDTDCSTGSIEDGDFKMDCGNVFESDPQREDWDVVHVIEATPKTLAAREMFEALEAIKAACNAKDFVKIEGTMIGSVIFGGAVLKVENALKKARGE